MRRQLGTVALAALLIGGCGGQSDTWQEASATCTWVRESVGVLPERTPDLLQSAAEHLRGLEAPETQRAAAGTLVAELGHMSSSADELSSELDADNFNPARLRRLRAAVQGDQGKIAAAATMLRISGCDAMSGGLVRAADREIIAGAPKRRTRPSYRTRLRFAVRDLTRRTTRVQAAIRSGNGSPSTLTDYAAFVGTAVRRLRPLRPPASVAPAHRDLVAGLRAMQTATTRAARHLRARGPQRATRVMRRFYASQASEALTAAAATLGRYGYLPS